MAKAFLLAYDQLIENRTNISDENIKDVIELADLLYQSRLFRFMIKSLDGESNEGEYYLEKISAHGRSINLILKWLFRRKSDLGETQVEWYDT